MEQVGKKTIFASFTAERSRLEKPNCSTVKNGNIFLRNIENKQAKQQTQRKTAGGPADIKLVHQVHFYPVSGLWELRVALLRL